MLTSYLLCQFIRILIVLCSDLFNRLGSLEPFEIEYYMGCLYSIIENFNGSTEKGKRNSKNNPKHRVSDLVYLHSRPIKSTKLKSQKGAKLESFIWVGQVSSAAGIGPTILTAKMMQWNYEYEAGTRLLEPCTLASCARHERRRKVVTAAQATKSPSRLFLNNRP